jgi:hypothetical protein
MAIKRLADVDLKSLTASRGFHPSPTEWEDFELRASLTVAALGKHFWADHNDPEGEIHLKLVDAFCE